jgi:hypothetical protein
MYYQFGAFRSATVVVLLYASTMIVVLTTRAFGHRRPKGPPAAFRALVIPFEEWLVHESVRQWCIFHLVFAGVVLKNVFENV